MFNNKNNSNLTPPYNHKRPEVWTSGGIAKKNCQPSSLLSARPRKFCKTKFAFTLAETLITLVIVGIIAAITVPVTLTNVRNKQIETRLKKTYSALSQTTARAIADNGPVKNWEIGEESCESSKAFTDKYLIPYLSIGKNCGCSTNQACSYSKFYMDKTPINNNGNDTKFFLNDGTNIILQIQHNDSNIIAFISIDINGAKKPNRVGNDIFEFKYVLMQGNRIYGQFVPESYDYNNYTITGHHGSCEKGKRGNMCAAVIMKNNWEIPSKTRYVEMGGIAENYPW